MHPVAQKEEHPHDAYLRKKKEGLDIPVIAQVISGGSSSEGVGLVRTPEEQLLNVYKKMIEHMGEVIKGDYNWMGKKLIIQKNHIFFNNKRYKFEKITGSVYMSKMEGRIYIFIWDIVDEMLRVAPCDSEPAFIERISGKVNFNIAIQ